MADHDTSGAPHITACPLDLSPCAKALLRSSGLTARAGAKGCWRAGSTAAPASRPRRRDETLQGAASAPPLLAAAQGPRLGPLPAGNTSGRGLRLSRATASQGAEFLPVFIQQLHRCLCCRTRWSGHGWVKREAKRLAPLFLSAEAGWSS